MKKNNRPKTNEHKEKQCAGNKPPISWVQRVIRHPLLVVCGTITLVAAAAFAWYPPLWQANYATAAVGAFFNEVQDSICLNTANAQELQLLPGIGEVKANIIVQYRDENGPFETWEELENVKGIGKKSIAQWQQIEGVTL